MAPLRLHPPALLLTPACAGGSTRSAAPRHSSVTVRAHSNPRLLKPQPRRSRRRSRRLSPPFDEDGDSESDGGGPLEDGSSDMHYPANLLSWKMRIDDKKRQGRKMSPKYTLEGGQPIAGAGMLAPYATRENNGFPDDLRSRQSKNGMHNVSQKSYALDIYTESQDERFSRKMFKKLQEELDFDEKWFHLIEYLSTFGLKESHFTAIYERHMPCLQINLASAEERLKYLLNVGVKSKDMKRVLVRQPQVLEYTIANLKAHVNFLVSIGVPEERIGQIIAAAPSFFSYSVEQSLKPTVQYLMEEIGVKEHEVGKMVQLSPQILVQRIENSWTSRFIFLTRELKASKDSIVKMVTKHPQLLHYSIEEGILPRINFLRNIGMRDADILKVLTSLTQVLSLSVERNLEPKYLYLVRELRHEVASLTKYPMYLSLSLEQRIRPRHLFLVHLRKAPKGPFPLSSLVPTDACFCQQWAGTSVDEYLAFRQKLLLNDLPIKQGKSKVLMVPNKY